MKHRPHRSDRTHYRSRTPNTKPLCYRCIESQPDSQATLTLLVLVAYGQYQYERYHSTPGVLTGEATGPTLFHGMFVEYALRYVSRQYVSRHVSRYVCVCRRTAGGTIRNISHFLHEREEFGTIRNTVTIRKFQSFQFGTIWNNSTTLYFRHFSLYWITALTTDGGSV